MSLVYYRTAELPDLQFWLLDDDGALVNLASGYTFSFKLGTPGAVASFDKTTLITGAAGSGTEPSGTPNLTIAFAADELDDIDPGRYVWQLTATSTSLDRVYQGTIQIKDVILDIPAP
jgi:hypothetical protein